MGFSQGEPLLGHGIGWARLLIEPSMAFSKRARKIGIPHERLREWLTEEGAQVSRQSSPSSLGTTSYERGDINSDGGICINSNLGCASPGDDDCDGQRQPPEHPASTCLQVSAFHGLHFDSEDSPGDG